MHKIRLKKYRIIRRSASVLLIMAFVVNFVLMDSWAVPVNPLRGPGPIQDSRFSVLDIETFSIPSYLGSVKYSSKGNSDKVVIHIQDAHSNYAAQNRIAEIIEYLHGEYGLEDINLEGGTGDYDLSVLTDIYDRDVRKRVADYFVKYGELNGAEFFALNNPDEVALWGVEDEDLYMENLNVYLDSLSYRDEVNAYLKELDFFLSNLKRHIFSGELMEFDMEYTRYKANDIDFKDYLSFILERAREKGVDIKMYTNIYLLGQAIEEEGGVDFKRANSQRDEIIAGLRNILSKNEMDRLMSKTIAFKSKRISQKEFYGYLLEKAGHAGQDMEAFPEFRKYIVYISLYDAADKFSIMREMEDLESRVKEALYQNDKQRELDRLSRNFILTRSMFELLFTKDDYRYYKENMPAFEVHNYITFIKEEAPFYGMTAKLDKDIAGLDAYRERIFEFYECSFKRDRAFLKNIRLAGAGDGPRAGILVTGGFHTENLLALLEEKDISYVSIIPGFRNEEGYRSPYFSVLSGGMSPLEKSIDSALSSIQVASLLNRLGIEAAGPERQEIFRIGVLALTSMEYDTEKRTKAVQLGLGEVREYVVVEMKDGEPALNKYRLSEKDFVRQFPDAEILVAAGVEEPGAAGMTWILSRVAEANIEKLPGERLKRDSPAVKAVRDLIRNLPRLEDTLEHILGTDGKYIEIKDGLRAPLVSGKAVYIPAMDEAGKRLSPSRQAVMIVHELVGGTFKGNMTRGYNNGHELASAVETALRAGHPVEAAEAMEGAELHPAGKTLWQMTDKEISQAEGMDFSGLIANAFVNVGVGVVAGIGDLAFNAGDKGVDYVIGALKGKTELQKEMAPFKKMYKTTGREMPDKIRAWLADTSPEKYEDLKKALTSANEARDLLEKTGLEPVTAAGLVLDFLAWRGRSVPPAPLMSDFHTLVRALEQAKLRPSAAESVLHSVLENRKIKAAWTLRSLADITANIRGYDDVRDLELENALKTIFRVVDDQFCQALLVLSVENITDDFRPVKTTILEKVRTERRNSEFFAHRYTSLSLLLALTRDYTERKKKEFEQGRSVFSFEGEGGETVEEVSGYLIGRLAELKEETLATQPVPAGTKLIEGESGDIRLRLMEDGDLLAKSMRDGKVMPLTIRGVKVKVKGRDLGKVEKSFIEFIKESGDYLITITTRDDVIRSINADKPEDKGWTEHVRWEEIVRQRNVRLKREKDRIEGKPAVKQGLKLVKTPGKQGSGAIGNIKGDQGEGKGKQLTGFDIEETDDRVIVKHRHLKEDIAVRKVGEAGENIREELAILLEESPRPEDEQNWAGTVIRQLIYRLGEVRVVAIGDHRDFKGYWDKGTNTLFLNDNLLKNPMSFLHEAGELLLGDIFGEVFNEEDLMKIKGIAIHTIMRGTGEDLRIARDFLIEAMGGIAPDMPPREYMRMLLEALETLGLRDERAASGKMRITGAEAALIIFNMGQGVSHFDSLEGVQGLIDPYRNADLTARIQEINRDLRGGKYTVHLLDRSNPEMVAQIANKTRALVRAYRKTYRAKMDVLTFDGSREESFIEAMEEAGRSAERENRMAPDSESVIVVHCNGWQGEPDENGLDKMDIFLNKLPERERAGLMEMMIKLKSPLPEGRLPDDVKIALGKSMALGNILADNKRFKESVGEDEGRQQAYRSMTARQLYGFQGLGLFNGTDAIYEDFENMDYDAIVDFMDRIFTGQQSMMITPFDFKEIVDWAEAEKQVRQAL